MTTTTPLPSSSSRSRPHELYVNVDYNRDRRSSQSLSPASSSANASTDSTTPSTTSNDSGTPLCVVLCMYDWASDDPDHLSFTKNEILDIVKQEDTGWWAAMRSDMRSDSEIGWIPHAYVQPLSQEMVDKLRQTPKQCRCQEYQAEQLYANPMDIPIYDPIEPSSPAPPSPRIQRHDWDPSRPNLTLSTRSRDISRTHEQDPSTSSAGYRIVIQRPQNEQTTRSLHFHSSRPQRFSHSHKTSQFLNPLDSETPHTRNRAGTHPVSAVVNATAWRRDESASTSATILRPVYELKSPDVAFSRSRTAIEGIIKRNNSSMVTQAFHEEAARVSDPWFLKPQYANQLETDENGQLRFGTLEALVEKLTTETTDLQNRAEDILFRNVFLMTFRTFMKSDDLFDMLVEACHLGGHPQDLTTKELEEWSKHIFATRTRVLELFTLWLTDHRLLQDDAHIARKLTGFAEGLPSTLTSAGRLLVKQIERLTFSINHPGSPRKTKKARPHKNDLLRLDPVDIAEQLTLIESERYIKVTPKECLFYSSKTATSSNLGEFCSTHDKVASWVKSSILTNEALSKRVSTIELWIKVAEKCKTMNNFASMSAIITALSSTVITRLHLTWAHVGRKNVYDSLVKHNEPLGGFAGYRNLLQNVEGPCVPFISMYLTDLVHIQDHFGDEPGGRICFHQRQRSYETISAMLRFQSRSYHLAESDTLITFIKRCLQTDGDKDTNWFWAKFQEVQQLEWAHADIRKGLEAAGF
ncbi:hypothetical protein H0H93_005747 [Arthromyces matolae]|nr:hypothetical protein H0H93_005747 [Arthromyces matolae]